MNDSGNRLPARRIETEARERAAQTLAHHFAADHIDAEELELRLARVYGATTAAELETVIADLPMVGPDPAAVAVKPTGRRISALFSAQEQQLTGVVPRRLEVCGRLGYVELDLTRATFEPGAYRDRRTRLHGLRSDPFPRRRANRKWRSRPGSDEAD